MGTNYLFRIQLILTLFVVVFAYRLPHSVVPKDYRLEIVTNLGDEEDKFNFKGTVWIQIECISPTDNITLHSKKLNISEDKTAIKSLNNTEGVPSISGVSLVPEDDFLVIKLSDPLKVNENYEIELHFEGNLDEVLAGYYRSYYTGENDEKTWLAVTQFEPYDARRAFPCFDEPSFKAKFTISLGRSEKYSSISNMPLVKTEKMENKPGWEWDRYETTLPMSTYLVAYAVTDFGYETSPPFGNNVTFRIWARKNAIDQTGFAQDIGPKFLNFFERYFEIDYPLPKQDMIAVPDFSAGAMENWGLITYREKYLLFDPKESPTIEMESIASVVAHELAHQWFGNLVTMKWWTDLWLNEGFATYMSAIAVEDVFPEWKSLEEETAINIMSVFSFDSLLNSHPVSVPINHPKEIEEIFDTISYKKGSYLLHMMSHFLGPETLRQGVRNYLSTYKYKNAEKDDLLQHITTEAHRTRTLRQDLTVKTVMDGWISQTGFPVITVLRDYKHGTMRVSQERFFRDGSKIGDDNTKWWIPLTYTTECEMAFNETKVRKWLSPKDESITIEIGIASLADWVILNMEASGLYRVNYDETNWNYLTVYLKGLYFRKIPNLNRVLLIDSAASLAWAGRLEYNSFLNLTEYLAQEMDYLPWRAGIRALNDLESLIKRRPVYDNFVNYMRRLVTPVYKQCGGFHMQEDEPLESIKQKIQITSTACKYGIEECVSQAVEMFKILQDHKEDIKERGFPNDLRGTIYCYAVRNGTEWEWNYLWEQYKNSNVAAVKIAILDALSCTRDHTLLNQYLEWSLDEKYIRKQDLVTVIAGIIRNKDGFIIAKEFLTKNVEALYKEISPSVSKLSSIISVVSRYIVTDEEYDWLDHLIKSNQAYFDEIKNGVNQALETAKLNVQWSSAHYPAVEEYFEA